MTSETTTVGTAQPTRSSSDIVFVDVIIPVHDASETIEETVHSAMNQIIPQHLTSTLQSDIDVAVCCYNDGSTDDSWTSLCKVKTKYDNRTTNDSGSQIKTHLLIGTGSVSRGAGFARNRAASLRPLEHNARQHFVCMLDSDDTMHKTRVAEQVNYMLGLQYCQNVLLGCTFDRDPPGSTWHYAQWANNLTDERLVLERFREVTILQPTWMMTKSRFQHLGGYIEASDPNDDDDTSKHAATTSNGMLRLVHETYDTRQSLRLAEDLRFFHAHLEADGLLRLHRASIPLVMYRHRAGMSQSSQTPRKLLLHLRVLAFETAILRREWTDKQFVIWGAGRDGKDFLKALSSDIRDRVTCFVDVDEKKIGTDYFNKQFDLRIPIVHFSWLASDPDRADCESQFGKVNKQGPDKRSEGSECAPQSKKRRIQTSSSVNFSLLPSLPVVVCVAMYRTNGALEANVKTVRRTEGKDLWHFS